MTNSQALEDSNGLIEDIVVCTSSDPIDTKIITLLEAINLKAMRLADGVEVFQNFIENSPKLIIINNTLRKMSCEQLLDQIATLNVANKTVTKVLVISDDNERDTIIKIMRPVKYSNGAIKLGLMISPWNTPDFYRQITNLEQGNEKLQAKVEIALTQFRNEEIKNLDETRLFLGVTEIGQGLRIELGNDRVLSATSETADDYAEKIERALLATSVEYIQFSLAETADLLPANVVAMMMLINGFSNKHKKEILFVSIPTEVKKQIQKFGLNEVLPLEQDVQLF